MTLFGGRNLRLSIDLGRYDLGHTNGMLIPTTNQKHILPTWSVGYAPACTVITHVMKRMGDINRMDSCLLEFDWLELDRICLSGNFVSDSPLCTRRWVYSGKLFETNTIVGFIHPTIHVVLFETAYSTPKNHGSPWFTIMFWQWYVVLPSFPTIYGCSLSFQLK